MTAMQTERPATDGQIDFIAVLASERQLNDEQAAWLQQTMEQGVNFDRASAIIKRMIPLPRKSSPAVGNSAPAPAEGQSAGESVPDGFYAVAMEGHRNDVSFYRLRTGKRGRWQGFQFIDLMASTTMYPQRGKEVREGIYAAIRAAGVNEARAAFGQKLGRCGCCNRPLTDETSRKLGIGPECRKGL